MSEYEHSLTVQAPPDAVYAFVADVGNLPKYLPTTHRAESEPGGKVRVEGEANGHRYSDDGHFHADRSARRLEWDSAGDRQYSGWLTVQGQGDGSNVTVHLSFGALPGDASDDKVRDGLEKGLLSIKNQCEGEGGKVEPKAAT